MQLRLAYILICSLGFAFTVDSGVACPTQKHDQNACDHRLERHSDDVRLLGDRVGDVEIEPTELPGFEVAVITSGTAPKTETIVNRVFSQCRNPKTDTSRLYVLHCSYLL